MRRAKVYTSLAVLLVAIGAVVASDATFWKRYFLSVAYAPSARPMASYEPTELVAGTNEPPPPRVSADYAGIDIKALNAAADYAGERDSRALIVWRRGHIAFEKYWGGSDFNTILDTGEFNATLVALLFGIAQQERKVGLVDEPAARYLPEWRNSAREAIKLRDLLQSSSGLAAYSPMNAPWSRAVRDRLGSDITSAYLQRDLAHEPGSRWVPQSADPQLLALVLERATGQRYAQYLSERLWKRIRAADAHLWLDRAGGSAHAECCLLARQGDWIRIGALLVSDGVFEGEEVVPPGWVAQMLSPAAGNANFGFQLRLGEPFVRAAAGEPYATRDVFFLGDFSKNRLWLVPSLGLVVLATGVNPTDAGDWDEARIPNLVIRGTDDFKPGANASSDLESLVPNH